MAGTNATLQTSGGGIILPVPIVRIVKNDASGTPWALPTPPNDGGTKSVNADLQVLDWLSTIAVTAQVDDSILDPALDLEVQLFHYRGKSSGRKTSGWTAPADHDPFLGVAGTGSHMLGGVASSISCARRTRAKVTTQGQREAFNLGGFFRRGPLAYIDPAVSGVGSPSQSILSDALLALPIDKTSNVSSSSSRNVQPWGRRRLNGYFAFAFSVADASGRTDGRIFGPMSHTVVAGSSTHPFAPNAVASAAFGFPACDLNPNYSNRLGRVWWAERQSERS